jgi:apolipoprotein N-acyltransferase
MQGYYRKTHPFPLTEHVPRWLDGPLLRRWLPWAGSWQPGSGARVFTLRASGGRELNVVPLICLDDVRPQLAIDGARLGAQAIIGLSNDAWFSAHPIGARLHLAVAAFRSIETRLPQLRVTSNGLSAFVDPTGEVIVQTRMGDRAVLVGEVPAFTPPPTLMVRWGDWVGGASLAVLLLLAAATFLRSPAAAHARAADTAPADGASATFDADVVVLHPAWRAVAAMLRAGAGAGLLWLAVRMWLQDGMQVNSLAQLQWFAAAVITPAIAAWAIRQVFSARARAEGGLLVLQQRARRIEIPLSAIAALRVWRLPLPGIGVNLQMASGRRWAFGIALADPRALLRALAATGAGVRLADRWSERVADFAAIRAAAGTHRLDHPLLKFLIFPLLPALPAFRLHQHIAFGGTFGEYYTYGLAAWLGGLLIWWAAWSLGLMLFAAAQRIAVEVITALLLRWRPARAIEGRRTLSGLMRVAYYLGVPALLLLRVVAD